MVAEIWAYGNVIICRPDGDILAIKTSSREGTDFDMNNLEQLFDQLGFTVVTYKDLTAQVGPNA